MNYTMTKPCRDCPFLAKMKKSGVFPLFKLRQFASGEFPCHETADEVNGNFVATEDSQHCAGALIFNEKRDKPHQMMRICERIGLYDRTKLDMKAKVR